MEMWVTHYLCQHHALLFNEKLLGFFKELPRPIVEGWKVASSLASLIW
jgi:hypothetical protein